MDVMQRLREIDWPTRFEQLGVHPEDREPLKHLIHEIQFRPEDLRTVTELADTIVLPGIGDYLNVWKRPGFGPEFADHELMRGALPTLALLVTADEVHAAHRARAIPDEVSWRALSDFGHQVAKTRWVEGRTGQHNHNWLRNAWSDGFLWLGRLEFEYAHMAIDDSGDQVDVINVHIPAGGSMTPAAVEESLRMAAEVMPRHYPEMAHVEWFACHSWLLDPVLASLVPGSNMTAFQSLWQGATSSPADRDGYYFGFDIEPPEGQELPYMLDELPADSRLHRAMIEHWRDGGHFSTVLGKLSMKDYR